MKYRTRWGILDEVQALIDVARKNPTATSEGLAMMRIIKLLIEVVLDIRDDLMKEEE